MVKLRVWVVLWTMETLFSLLLGLIFVCIRHYHHNNNKRHPTYPSSSSSSSDWITRSSLSDRHHSSFASLWSSLWTRSRPSSSSSWRQMLLRMALVTWVMVWLFTSMKVITSWHHNRALEAEIAVKELRSREVVCTDTTYDFVLSTKEKTHSQRDEEEEEEERTRAEEGEGYVITYSSSLRSSDWRANGEYERRLFRRRSDRSEGGEATAKGEQHEEEEERKEQEEQEQAEATIAMTMTASTPESIDTKRLEAFRVAFVGDSSASMDSVEVLRMVKREEARVMVHLGDMDYRHSPELWFDLLDEHLGFDYPVVQVVGNHDVLRFSWSQYARKIASRWTRFQKVFCFVLFSSIYVSSSFS